MSPNLSLFIFSVKPYSTLPHRPNKFLPILRPFNPLFSHLTNKINSFTWSDPSEGHTLSLFPNDISIIWSGQPQMILFLSLLRTELVLSALEKDIEGGHRSVTA